jgi:large subunit ribosomal protein L10
VIDNLQYKRDWIHEYPHRLILNERRNVHLAITRKKKEELLEVYKEQIDSASAVVFADYRGINVSKIQSLRTKMKETGTTFMVVKNSIMALALDQLEREYDEASLTGTKAVAFCGEDIGSSVKALKDWIKAADVGSIEGALIETSVLDAAGAEALSDLPSKEQVLSMILGAISAPSGNLVRTINAPASSLARVLNARVQQMEEAA